MGNSWDEWAEVYDEVWAELDTAEVVDHLNSLAPGGTFLELGAGTGRVCVPLAQLATSVVAVELSRRMAEKLSEKAGPNTIVIVGDMVDYLATTPVDVVYCIFNSFVEVLDQSSQIKVLQNARESVKPGGYVVLETSIPSAGGILASRQQVAIRDVAEGHATISLSMNDPLNQRVSFREVTFSNSGVRVLDVENRFVWPGELDLMATMAGLRLENRFDGWRGVLATANSRSMVSIYRHED